MKNIVDWAECQRDSPVFRQILEENEKDLESLELKLEKVVKQCYQMVQAGKTYNQEQSHLVKELWELSDYFSSDPAVQSSLNTLLESMNEVTNFHRILIDQATRSINKNFRTFIKNDLKGIKESQYRFEKSSSELDTLLNRASSKVNDAEDLDSQVLKTRKAFRHNAIDYVSAISLAQGKKRYEIIYAVMSYLKAYSTFYHQGTDHLNDLELNFESISQNVNKMQLEVDNMKKDMESVHQQVTGDSLVLSEDMNGENVSMQGYLFKRSNNAFKSWNHRYFTLQNNQLVYRKRSGEDITVMEEDMRLCNVKPALDVDRRFCFEVTSNTKSHMLQAESSKSCKEWIDSLQNAIASALDQPILDTDRSFTGSTHSSPLNSPSSQYLSSLDSKTSNLNITPNTIWNRILKIPGNEMCCDCHSPNPKWASINLGITLCIECSGIHRSLGVHYSKVRSLTLDNWDHEVLCLMERLGNNVINQIYLSKIKDDKSVSGYYSPASPSCNRGIREEWIRSKYVQKLFVVSADDESAVKNTLQILLTHKRKSARRRKLQQSHGTPDKNLSSSSLNTTTLSSDIVPLEEAKMDSGSLSSIPSDSQDSSISDSIEDNNECSLEQYERLCHDANSLMKAASKNANLPMMGLALAMKAEKNHRCDNKKTALHYAILSGSSIAVEYMLLNGAQTNAQDLDLKTPLHLAAQHSNIFQVYRLLMYRAPQNLKDSMGNTPLDLAVKDGEPDLVTLLRVATLSDQLEWEAVEKEIRAIMVEIHHNRTADT